MDHHHKGKTEKHPKKVDKPEKNSSSVSTGFKEAIENQENLDNLVGQEIKEISGEIGESEDKNSPEINSFEGGGEEDTAHSETRSVEMSEEMEADYLPDSEEDETPGEAAESPTSLLVIQNKRLLAQVKSLEEDKKETRDWALRIQAEFENSKKRLFDQNARERDYQKGEILKRFITVYEEFHQVSSMEITPELDWKKYHEGVQALYKKFAAVLKESDLETFGEAGETFDPVYHQALSMVPTDDPEKDQVIERVLARGYLMKKQVIRPAMVIIFNNS